MKSKINIVALLLFFLSLTSFDNPNTVKPQKLKVIQTQVNCQIIAKNTFIDCVNHGFDVFTAIHISSSAYNSCKLITANP